ncbi:MAG TPA: sulfocyanin-like copper-binding protein [Humibacillus sp.]|nr:sulfocyanin-like copper-binding protein [Humibacillus sp.]
MARHVRLGQTARLAVAVAAVGALLAGCTGTATGPGRMDAYSAGQGGMMGARSAMTAPLTCAAPADLPGQQVTVTLTDMGMSRVMGGIAPMGALMSLTAQPTTVPAGEVSLVVDNLGWRTHELVVLPLAEGAVAGQRVPSSDGKVDETGSLGEASSSCAAGEGEGIASGAVGWVTLTLAPGHYELVCNLTNHYANGMRQELVVTG